MTLNIPTGDNTQIGSLTGGGTTGGNVTLGTATLTVGGDNSSTAYAGVFSGTGGALTKIGSGTFTLTGTNTYTGSTTVSNGTLLVNGSTASTSSVSVSNGAIMGGSGTVAGPVSDSGTLSPGQASGSPTAVLNTGAETFNSGAAFDVDLGGTTPGSGYDQLNVAGTVSIAATTLLNVNLASGYTPAPNTTYTILASTGAISGTFNGLANGATFTSGGTTFQITYNTPPPARRLTSAYAPTVTTNPTSQTVNAGQSVTFTAAANGAPAPTVQWQVNTGSGFSDISGATSASYTIATTSAGQSTYQYQAVFTSTLFGTVTTSAATLTVDSITTRPVSQTGTASQSVTFTAGTSQSAIRSSGMSAPTAAPISPVSEPAPLLTAAPKPRP